MDKAAVPEGDTVTSIWLVEDNAVFRNGITRLINESPGMECELAVGSCEEALQHLDSDAAPDVLLMDIGLPGIDGIEGVRRIRSIAPSVRVIMLTVFDENEKIFDAICAGASGYLLKSAPPDEIIVALQDMLKGGAPMNAHIARKVLDLVAEIGAPKGNYPITASEKEILHRLVDGHPKKQIAYDLNISFHTVDRHVRSIYTKLQVNSRSAAVAKALKERLL